MSYILTYLGVTLAFILIDFIWLGIVAKRFYQQQLGGLMRENVQIHIAALFYLFYTIGIVLFAVAPAVGADSILMAAGYGAFLGFLAYGTYDVTNVATLKGWPILMSVVDVVWGMIISAAVAAIGYCVYQQVA